jgi:hypothetical protein
MTKNGQPATPSTLTRFLARITSPKKPPSAENFPSPVKASPPGSPRKNLLDAEKEKILEAFALSAIKNDDVDSLELVLQLACSDSLQNYGEDIGNQEVTLAHSCHKLTQLELLLQELLCFQYKLHPPLSDLQPFPADESIQQRTVYVRKSEDRQGLIYKVRSDNGTIKEDGFKKQQMIEMGLSMEDLYPLLSVPAQSVPAQSVPAQIDEQKKEEQKLALKASQELAAQEAKIKDLQEVGVYIEDPSERLETLTTSLGIILKMTAERGHTHDIAREDNRRYSKGEMSELEKKLRKLWTALSNGNAENIHTFFLSRERLSSYNGKAYEFLRLAEREKGEQPDKKYLNVKYLNIQECRAYLQKNRPWMFTGISIDECNQHIEKIINTNTPYSIANWIKELLEKIKKSNEENEELADKFQSLSYQYAEFVETYVERYETELTQKTQKIYNWLNKNNTGELAHLSKLADESERIKEIVCYLSTSKISAFSKLSSRQEKSLFEYAKEKGSQKVIEFLENLQVNMGLASLYRTFADDEIRDGKRELHLLYLAKAYMKSRNAADRTDYEKAYKQTTLAEKKAGFKALLRKNADHDLSLFLREVHPFEKGLRDLEEISEEDKPLMAHLLGHKLNILFSKKNQSADERILRLILKETRIPLLNKEESIDDYNSRYTKNYRYARHYQGDSPKEMQDQRLKALSMISADETAETPFYLYHFFLLLAALQEHTPGRSDQFYTRLREALVARDGMITCRGLEGYIDNAIGTPDFLRLTFEATSLSAESQKKMSLSAESQKRMSLEYLSAIAAPRGSLSLATAAPRMSLNLATAAPRGSLSLATAAPRMSLNLATAAPRGSLSLATAEEEPEYKEEEAGKATVLNFDNKAKNKTPPDEQLVIIALYFACLRYVYINLTEGPQPDTCSEKRRIDYFFNRLDSFKVERDSLLQCLKRPIFFEKEKPAVICSDHLVMKDLLDSLQQDKEEKKEEHKEGKSAYPLGRIDYLHVVTNLSEDFQEYRKNSLNPKALKYIEITQKLAGYDQMKKSNCLDDQVSIFIREKVGFNNPIPALKAQQRRLAREELRDTLPGRMTEIEQLDALFKLETKIISVSKKLDSLNEDRAKLFHEINRMSETNYRTLQRKVYQKHLRTDSTIQEVGALLDYFASGTTSAEIRLSASLDLMREGGITQINDFPQKKTALTQCLLDEFYNTFHKAIQKLIEGEENTKERTGLLKAIEESNINLKLDLPNNDEKIRQKLTQALTFAQSTEKDSIEPSHVQEIPWEKYAIKLTDYYEEQITLLRPECHKIFADFLARMLLIWLLLEKEESLTFENLLVWLDTGIINRYIQVSYAEKVVLTTGTETFPCLELLRLSGHRCQRTDNEQETRYHIATTLYPNSYAHTLGCKKATPEQAKKFQEELLQLRARCPWYGGPLHLRLNQSGWLTKETSRAYKNASPTDYEAISADPFVPTAIQKRQAEDEKTRGLMEQMRAEIMKSFQGDSRTKNPSAFFAKPKFDALSGDALSGVDVKPPRQCR